MKKQALETAKIFTGIVWDTGEIVTMDYLFPNETNSVINTKLLEIFKNAIWQLWGNSNTAKIVEFEVSDTVVIPKYPTLSKLKESHLRNDKKVLG